MLWPDIANEPAHDHPVLAALLLGCDMSRFRATLGTDACRGGEMERQRGQATRRTEAVYGGQGLPLEGGPRECSATACGHQHGRCHHYHTEVQPHLSQNVNCESSPTFHQEMELQQHYISLWVRIQHHFLREPNEPKNANREQWCQL